MRIVRSAVVGGILGMVPFGVSAEPNGLDAITSTTTATTALESVEEPLEPPMDTVERPAEKAPDQLYTMVVRGTRPPRSASDWTFELKSDQAGPIAGGSGAELLRKAPGVYITQHSGQGKGHQIFLRGFDAVHGQDVEITAGGIPVNEVSNIHAQGYADLHFLIPEAVLRMRVLEGAFDPRQGDFAVAGSIDFDLGLRRRGLMGRISAGQYGLLRGLVAWGPPGEPDETFVAAELVKADGFGPARAWNRAGAIGQAILPLSPRVDVRFFGSSYAGRYDSAGVIRADDLDRRDFFDTYDSTQGGLSTRHQALLEIRHDDVDMHGRFSTFVVLRDFRLRSNFTGFLVDSNGDRIEQNHTATVFGGRGSFRTTLFDDVSAEVGLSFRHEDINQSQERLRAADGEPYRTEIDNRLGVTDVGVYGDLEIYLLDRLRLQGGLRAEALSFSIDEGQARDGVGDRREAFGFHLAPKVTLEYRPTDTWSLFASYGNGFRSPQAASLGQGERSPLTVVNAGEVGLRAAWGAIFSGTVTGFLTHIEEDLIFDHAVGRNIFSGPTWRGGGTLLLEIEPWSFLHLTGSATYTRAVKVDTGDQVPFVPALVLRADADAQHEVGKLFGQTVTAFGSLGLSATSERPLPFSESGQGVFVLDATLGARTDHVGVSVEAFNLTDTRWRDAEFVYASQFEPNNQASNVPVRHLTAGRPLTMQVTLSFYQ